MQEYVEPRESSQDAMTRSELGVTSNGLLNYDLSPVQLELSFAIALSEPCSHRALSD